jgi:Dehydrogenases with different specificities (related to short-chain alcohol dehydrogenases)
MTDKQWDTMLAVHNTAPFRLVRAAAPYFRVKDKEPRVVINISSTSGIHGNAYVLQSLNHSRVYTQAIN